MELEWHQLELKYQGLRVIDATAQARLMASLGEHGQRVPVLVVAAAPPCYVLIKGYRRVAALRRLGRDTVQAAVLEMSEAEALLFAWGMSHRSHRSVLEEAWLLRALHDSHGFALSELALRFGRSASWVSRRLALLEAVPGDVESLLRSSTITPQAAMKYLVPLARANTEHGRMLTAALASLGGTRLSTRQVANLYDAWRWATPEQQQQIVSRPLVAVRALHEAGRSDAPDGITPSDSVVDRFAAELEILVRASFRARRLYRCHLAPAGGVATYPALGLTWQAACEPFASVHGVIAGAPAAPNPALGATGGGRPGNPNLSAVAQLSPEPSHA
ncbi:MAG: ParB/RepB/Spo0J family partition protein [Candidatus Schekmanbacteria bacterium]|nr:ParB/RepB/Spo0J family partition protein [Candidatus Schekmanbacteria bacterium]